MAERKNNAEVLRDMSQDSFNRESGIQKMPIRCIGTSDTRSVKMAGFASFSQPISFSYKV